jgi:hypothetical protein
MAAQVSCADGSADVTSQQITTRSRDLLVQEPKLMDESDPGIKLRFRIRQSGNLLDLRTGLRLLQRTCSMSSMCTV